MLSLRTAAVASLGIGIFFFFRWFRRRASCQCRCPRDLSGALAIVTGANSGIGAAIAQALVCRNCHVILACRSFQRGRQALSKLAADHPDGLLTFLQLDLASPASVTAFVETLASRADLPPLQLLVNNAGIYGTPDAVIDATGLEAHFAVNHLGHFLLTRLLLSRGLLSPGARVVNVSSSLAVRGDLSACAKIYRQREVALSSSQLYANSKLANYLFTQELHRRYGSSDDGIVAVCVQTDGMTNSGLFRHVLARQAAPIRPFLRLASHLLLRSPREGAQNAVYCCLASAAELKPGVMYSHCRPKDWPDSARRVGDAQALWALSEELASRFEVPL